MKDAIANLDRERKAAQALRESMASLRLDEDTVRDTVEGETNLHEAIIAALLEITEFEALRDGVESVITKLAARKESFDNRIALLRSAIEQAMVIGEMESFKSPLATLSIKPTPPKVIVSDEAAIPTEYWKQRDPDLDKRALLAALKDGIEIPGASLSNGGVTLQLRRS